MKKCGKTCFMNRNGNALIVLCLAEENKCEGRGIFSRGADQGEGALGAE